MINKMILLVNIPIYVFFLHYVKPQYNPPVYDIMQQGYQYPFQNIRYPYSNQRSKKNYENNKWMEENYDDYNDYTEENNCACDKCHETINKPSCKDVCPNCFDTPPLIAPSYVFLPFPYPYPITPNTTLAATTTIENTSTSTPNAITTTAGASTTKIETKAPRTEKAKTTEDVTLSNILPEENNEILKDKFPVHKGQFTLTALRRTKPNWLPKYGIVPISDKFAEKLMLQLRNMRVLHPPRDN